MGLHREAVLERGYQINQYNIWRISFTLQKYSIGHLASLYRTGTGYVSTYMLDVFHWLPLQQRIMLYWCHGLEVYPGSCSGLPPRSLLSRPGHQRSQFTTLI